MQSQFKQVDFSGQPIYVGIDVHLKSWAVSIYTSDLEHKTFHQEANVGILVNYLHRNFPNADVECVYEAGFSGFSLAEQLKIHGMKCKVVNAGDVPTSGKEKDQKRDKVDSRKLGKGLRQGDLEGIYLPDKDIQMDRILLRTRDKINKDTRRVKSRIKMMLHFTGISLPEGSESSYWSAKFLKWLDEIELPKANGTFSLRTLLKELRFLRELDKEQLKEIRNLSKSERYFSRVQLLSSIPGVSIVGAMIWLTEIASMERFKNAEQLCSYIGLIPSTNSSGEKTRIGEMTHRGNARLRTLLIEQTWVAVRKDPALALKFSVDAKRIGKNKAIVKCARRLLKRLRHIWLNNVPYTTGISE